MKLSTEKCMDHNYYTHQCCTSWYMYHMYHELVAIIIHVRMYLQISCKTLAVYPLFSNQPLRAGTSMHFRSTSDAFSLELDSMVGRLIATKKILTLEQSLSM